MNQKLKQDLDNKNIELLNIETTDAESVFVPSNIVKLVEQRQDYPFKTNYELTVLPTKEGEMVHKIIPKISLTKQTSGPFICLTLTEGKSMIINKSSLIKNLDNLEPTIKVTNYKGEEIILNKCDIVGIKQYEEKEFNLIPPQSSEVISELNKQIKSSFILIEDTNGKSQLVRKEYKDLILNSGLTFDIFNIPNEKHEMIKVSKQSLVNVGENKEFIFVGIKDDSFYLDKEHFNEPYSHNELYEEKIGYSTQEKDKKVFVKCTEIMIKDLELVNNLPEQEKKSTSSEDKLKELQEQIKNDDRKIIQVDKVFIPKTMVKLVKEDTSFPERDSFKVRDYKGEVVPINKNDLDKNKDEYLVGIIEGDKNQKIIPQKDLEKQLNQENIKPTTQLSSTDLLTGKPFSYTYNKLSLVNYPPQLTLPNQDEIKKGEKPTLKATNKLLVTKETEVLPTRSTKQTILKNKPPQNQPTTSSKVVKKFDEKKKKEIETAMKNIRTIKGRIDYLKKNYNDKYMRIRELMQAIVTTKNLKKIYFQKWANKVFHDVQEVEIVKSGKIERVRLERKIKHNIVEQEKGIPGQKETEEQEDEFLNQKQKLLEELKKEGNYLVKYNEQVYLNSSLSDKIINDNVPKDNYYATNYINKTPVIISKKTLSEEVPKENNKYIILQKNGSVVNKSELIDSIIEFPLIYLKVLHQE